MGITQGVIDILKLIIGIRGVISIGAENRGKQYYMNNTKTFRH